MNVFFPTDLNEAIANTEGIVINEGSQAVMEVE